MSRNHYIDVGTRRCVVCGYTIPRLIDRDIISWHIIERHNMGHQTPIPGDCRMSGDEIMDAVKSYHKSRR